ncbi:Putative mitochondrial 2-oxoglutarate/malate carrier protein [Seminavis robusta]|uniref:Mitochondrial 2-oxoglutarate/malate carrier protein n=2 Tax=Seminavis robusta TaxID=568900 RepID=A0A9N8EYT3_9STRA|nr:Putative mitochondrial 2-oxoglutarate/malate carrier protein [Seminavis robusta]|eukprot:Sro2550_g330920.1 Putative mitochondrial 2-oxoglutarate/malate carrier protein (312) ;mRNA; f:718-1749
MGGFAAGKLAVKMVIAAFSGMGAATICHPLDVIRVQMQTEGGSYTSPLDCANQIVKQEGLVNGLYAGISAAYLRQWLYGSCRIGIYAFLLEQAQTNNIAAGLEKNAIPLAHKMAMGLTSGGIGSFVGTPSELALVRMSADSKLPEKERRNYKSVVDCVSRIANEEGIPQLWRGAKVTVLRAMVLSACAMGMTSDIKQRLVLSKIFGDDGQMFHGLPLMFCATLVSSFAANIVANPLDVIKSRMQNQKVEKDGTSAKYKSMVDCFWKILADEGVLKLWAGFTPAFLKLAPYTIISLILTEKITMVVTGKAAL